MLAPFLTTVEKKYEGLKRSIMCKEFLISCLICLVLLSIEYVRCTRVLLQHGLLYRNSQLMDFIIMSSLVSLYLICTFYCNESGDVNSFICLNQSLMVIQNFAVGYHLSISDNIFTNNWFLLTVYIQALCSSLSLLYPFTSTGINAIYFQNILLGIIFFTFLVELIWMVKYLITQYELYGHNELFLPDDNKKCVTYIVGALIVNFTYYSTNLSFLFPSYDKMNLVYITILNLNVIIYFSIIPHVQRDFLKKTLSDEESDLIIRFISHEMRTPLHSVMVGVRLIHDALIAERLDEEDEVYLILKDIRQATEASLSRLNNILTRDSLRQGIYSLDRKTVLATDFLEACTKPFAIEAIEKGLSLIILPSEGTDNVLVDIDIARMNLVVGNILVNAINFTPVGGIINVSMRYHQDEMFVSDDNILQSYGELQISICDSGHGMSQREVMGLFKSPIQYNPGLLQHGGGFGLGLVIAKGIADLHGATLSAASEGLGRGSTLTIKIPAYKSSNAATLAQPAARNSVCARRRSERLTRRSVRPSFVVTTIQSHELPDGDTDRWTRQQEGCHQRNDSFATDLSSPERRLLSSRGSIAGHRFMHSPAIIVPEYMVRSSVLVVEDSGVARRMLCRVLAKNFSDIVEAEDGAISVVKYQERINEGKSFDLITMDFQMPNMDGPTAAGRLRSLGYRGKLVGVTGNVLPQDVDVFLTAGASRVFFKPLDVDQFNTWVIGAVQSQTDE